MAAASPQVVAAWPGIVPGFVPYPAARVNIILLRKYKNHYLFILENNGKLRHIFIYLFKKIMKKVFVIY